MIGQRSMAARAMGVVHPSHGEISPLVIAVTARARLDLIGNLSIVVNARGLVTFAALGVDLLVSFSRSPCG